jgi:hypothetical protein
VCLQRGCIVPQGRAFARVREGARVELGSVGAQQQQTRAPSTSLMLPCIPRDCLRVFVHNALQVGIELKNSEVGYLCAVSHLWIQHFPNEATTKSPWMMRPDPLSHSRRTPGIKPAKHPRQDARGHMHTSRVLVATDKNLHFKILSLPEMKVLYSQ